MKNISQTELLEIAGGWGAQALGCVGGAVGNTVSNAQGNPNISGWGLAASAVVGCASGALAATPAMQTAALTVAVVGNQAINAATNQSSDGCGSMRYDAGGYCTAMSQF